MKTKWSYRQIAWRQGLRRCKKALTKTRRNLKSQSIVNNAINEIKNTLEGTNSRITEAEEKISALEGRIVEINEAQRKKSKNN